MKTAVALGTFDGLHPGHRAVLKNAAQYNATAVTFRVPPKQSNIENPDMLLLPEDKCKRMHALGIKAVELLDFSEVCMLSPEEFFNRITDKLSPARICCGYNYRFGKNAAGDTRLLSKLCSSRGIELCCSECVEENGAPISSTRIRSMLRDGRLEEANRYIYGGFGFKAEVLHGDARGRTIGFPTINQKYPEALVALKPGVYAAEIIIDDKCYMGVSNIGVRPTFLTCSVYAETYIKDFSSNIYGQSVELKPLRFIRPEKKFGSLDELKAAISRDIRAIEE